MQDLHFYNSLLNDLQQTAPETAENLEEEVNILIHKLKFINEEQRPFVLILSQKLDYEPLVDEQVFNSISIAGGNPIQEKYDNPSVLIIVQDNESLYSELPTLLQDDILTRSDAIEKNQIYVIQNMNFGKSTDSFLADTEICAEIIQPKYFIYGRQGIDWVKFELA